MAGIAEQLRQAVLQAAIQGKLTERLPEDGDARDLLVKIKQCDSSINGQRVKAKEILEIGIDDEPFNIPNNWKWIRLGAVCIVARGGSPRPIKDYITDSPDGINWIKIGDTEKNGKYIIHTAEKIKAAGVSKSRLVHSGDFLLTNSMSFGRPYILKTDGCIHDGWLVISQPIKVYDENYLYWLLSSNFAYCQFSGKVSGAVVKNLNSDKVANSILPLPPLTEQHRIVARVEELMAKIDELEKVENELNALHKAFPGDMKAALLQAAMQGKLTEQLPKEKTDDIEQNLHIDNKLRQIEDVPFDIPQNWKWIQVGNLGESADTDSFADGPFGSNLKREHQIATHEVRIIQLSNIGENGWRNENEKYTSFKHLETKIPRCEVTPGCIVIAKMMPAGRAIIVPELGTRITLGSDAMKFKPNSILNKRFLLYALRSQAFLSQVYADVHGITRVRTTLKGIKEYVLPIPPLAEQQRIVERLDKLLPLCDSLEEKL